MVSKCPISIFVFHNPYYLFGYLPLIVCSFHFWKTYFSKIGTFCPHLPFSFLKVRFLHPLATSATQPLTLPHVGFSPVFYCLGITCVLISFLTFTTFLLSSSPSFMYSCTLFGTYFSYILSTSFANSS